LYVGLKYSIIDLKKRLLELYKNYARNVTHSQNIHNLKIATKPTNSQYHLCL
jgi:hypothetical protein